MKIIVICLLVISFSSNAQINRSAKELATENVQDYLNTKLFKEHNFKIISQGELKPYREADPDIHWILEHKIESVEIQKDEQQSVTSPTKLKFIFYLNKKMSVVRAEKSNF